MAFVGVGFEGHFGFGEEVSYNSPVARPYFIEINSENLVLEEDKIEAENITRRGVVENHVEQGAKRVSGSFEFEAMYGGWLKLAKHAFGAINTSTPDVTSNPTVKRHLFTITDFLPTGLTFEVFRATPHFVTEPNKAHIYSGCKINSIDFSCSVGEALMISCDVIGADESRNTKSAAPNFSTEKLAVYHQGALVWGSDSLPIESWSISLENGLDFRNVWGSRVTREPLPADKIGVTGSMTLEFESWNQYQDFRDSTSRSMTVTFTGASISGSFNRYIKFTASVTKILAVRCVLNSPGRIMLEIDFKAYRSYSTPELSLEVQSTETGI